MNSEIEWDEWYHEDGSIEGRTPYVHGKERPELLDPEHRLTYLVIFGEAQPEAKEYNNEPK